MHPFIRLNQEVIKRLSQELVPASNEEVLDFKLKSALFSCLIYNPTEILHIPRRILKQKSKFKKVRQPIKSKLSAWIDEELWRHNNANNDKWDRERKASGLEDSSQVIDQQVSQERARLSVVGKEILLQEELLSRLEEDGQINDHSSEEEIREKIKERFTPTDLRLIKKSLTRATEDAYFVRNFSGYNKPLQECLKFNPPRVIEQWQQLFFWKEGSEIKFYILSSRSLSRKSFTWANAWKILAKEECFLSTPTYVLGFDKDFNPRWHKYPTLVTAKTLSSAATDLNIRQIASIEEVSYDFFLEQGILWQK